MIRREDVKWGEVRRGARCDGDGARLMKKAKWTWERDRQMTRQPGVE